MEERGTKAQRLIERPDGRIDTLNESIGRASDHNPISWRYGRAAASGPTPAAEIASAGPAACSASQEPEIVRGGMWQWSRHGTGVTAGSSQD